MALGMEKAPAGNPGGGNAPTTNTGAVSSGGGTALGAIAGGIIGMGQGAINNNQNKKAQERSYEMQKALNKQAADLAYEQWLKTNAKAQVKEYKKAGLSIGLMYEGGGAGGQTSTGSGGSAPSQAPAQYLPAGMAMEGIAQMKQMQLMDAQINKINAEAENLRGADRANTIQDTALKGTVAEGNELANKLMGKTLDDQAEIIKHTLLKVAGEGQQEQAKGTRAVEREGLAVQQDKANIAYAIAKTKLAEKGIQVADAQIMKMAEDIAIGKFNAETARNTIGVDKATGSLIQNLVNEMYQKTGYDKDKVDQKVDDGKK